MLACIELGKVGSYGGRQDHKEVDGKNSRAHGAG
jgi:hypothetical protein